MGERWRPLCSIEELDIDTTLRCGQTFRWVRLGGGDGGENTTWRGTVGRAVVSLQAKDGAVSWRLDASHGASNVTDALLLDTTEAAVRDYFRLSDAFSLPALYRSWSSSIAPESGEIGESGDDSSMVKDEDCERHSDCGASAAVLAVGSKRARDAETATTTSSIKAEAPALKRSKSASSEATITATAATTTAKMRSKRSTSATTATIATATTTTMTSKSSKLSGQVRVRQRFSEVAGAVRGLRLLRQPPVECTFSFICSQNNNVARIQQLVRSLAEQAGTEIATIEGERYFMFPTVEALSKLTEKDLRSRAFGYRAKYIPAAASKILERSRQHLKCEATAAAASVAVSNDGDPGSAWLYSLRATPYNETHQELQTLDGVGPKVADCIALFSLDKLDTIPVDTHVRQIASRYMSGLDQKTVSRAVYERIGDFFRSAFPLHAGWAHSILFAAELRSFQAKLKAEGDPKK